MNFPLGLAFCFHDFFLSYVLVMLDPIGNWLCPGTQRFFLFLFFLVNQVHNVQLWGVVFF